MADQIADGEIVDRVMTAQILAGSPVALVTYNTGMSAWARNKG